MDQSTLATLFWTLLGFSAVVPLVLAAVAVFFATRRPRHPWTWWVALTAVAAVVPGVLLLTTSITWCKSLAWAAEWEATRHENLPAIRLIREMGLEEKDAPFLVMAILDRHYDLVPWLLSEGADPNGPAKFPAVILATQHGKPDLVRLLLKAGADANAAEPTYGLTCLHYAAMFGNLEIAELLLRKGADIDARDRRGYTPLRCACSVARPEYADIALCLLEHGAVVVSTELWFPAEWMVAGTTGEKVVELILDRTTDVNARGQDGATLLWRAAAAGNCSLAEKLLARGADATICDATGRTLLHAAAAGGSAALVERFLKMSFPAQVVDNNRQTPLHAAAVNDTTDVAELLFSCGAAWEVYDRRGDTPLHLAVRNGKVAVVCVLLAYGARPEVKNNRGQRPVDVADDACRKAIDEYLQRSRER